MGAVPVPFSVPYDPTTIDPNADYVAQGSIWDGSTTWLTSAGVPVITKDNARSNVVLTVTPVPTPSPTAAPTPAPSPAVEPPPVDNGGGSLPILLILGLARHRGRGRRGSSTATGSRPEAGGKGLIPQPGTGLAQPWLSGSTLERS